MLEREVLWQGHFLLIGDSALPQVQVLQSGWQIIQLCEHVPPELQVLKLWQAVHLRTRKVLYGRFITEQEKDSRLHAFASSHRTGQISEPDGLTTLHQG